MVFDEFGAMAKAVLGVGLSLAVGFIILASVKTNILTQEGLATTGCINSTACNSTAEVVGALGTLPGWLGLLVLIGVAGVILTLVRKLRS